MQISIPGWVVHEHLSTPLSKLLDYYHTGEVFRICSRKVVSALFHVCFIKKTDTRKQSVKIYLLSLVEWQKSSRYAYITNIAKLKLYCISAFIHGVSHHNSFANKNIIRHTPHTIVSWPNLKQWLMIHTSDLMMIIRQSTHSHNHHRRIG